jgi:aryl-alcohol dehydrogenase-like predicted oxidoreductase
MTGNLSRLGLGTVQFGIPYGVTNHSGITSESDVSLILNEAVRRGVRTLDTASLYGKSEAVLGKTIGELGFRIVTKSAKGSLTEGLKQSLEKLGRPSVYGLLLHDTVDMNANSYKELLGFKEQGIVQKIGISAYNTSEIEQVIDQYDIDLIQIPVSVFDQRLVKNGMLKKLKAKNIEIHARSAFLQGIALENATNLPAHLHGLFEPLTKFRTFCEQRSIDQTTAALSFVLGLLEIDCVICGVNTPAQFTELCDRTANIKNIPTEDFAHLAVAHEKLINPGLWKAQA